MSQPYSPGNQIIFHLTSAGRWHAPLCSSALGARWVPGDPRVPLHSRLRWLFERHGTALHLSYLSGFYIVPADMLSEFFFTHLKCHFIYGYWIEQSFICSWLHLFVAWLKWMLLQVYVKNHLSLWAGIWKKAAKCTLQYYFSFFDVLLQHQIQFSIFFSKIKKVSFLYHCIFILLHG